MKSKVNVKRVLAMLKRKRKSIPKVLRAGVVDGMRMFEARIMSKQMSGRVGAHRGLRVQTGNLRGSWHIRVSTRKSGTFVVLGTRVKYARVHQYGHTIKPRNAGKLLRFKIGNQWVSKKKVVIPKRLYILEDFKLNGRKLLKRGVKRALSRAFSGTMGTK